MKIEELIEKDICDSIKCDLGYNDDILVKAEIKGINPCGIETDLCGRNHVTYYVVSIIEICHIDTYTGICDKSLYIGITNHRWYGTDSVTLIPYKGK